MAKLLWDQTGERLFETGVDHGVLFPFDANNHAYATGVAWNGLTSVQEKASGGEANPLYADNIKYLNLRSFEEFEATVEAYTYPDEFAALDGTATIATGVIVGQQKRGTFGMSYRTKLGNDTEGDDYGYKIHLIYGAVADPAERQYETINDNPDAVQFSWNLKTTPVSVSGLKPTAHLIVESTKVNPTALAAFEEVIYGSASSSPRLPLPDEVASIFNGAISYTYAAVTNSEHVGASPMNEGWYESNGSGGYVLSTDAVIDGTKTYYIRSLTVT
jgi:hypothetical protein